MRTNRILACMGILAFVFIVACQRDAKDVVADQNNSASSSQSAAKAKPGTNVTAPCNPNAYVVTLESRTLVNGNWEWVWSVRNPNPGNGSNGTVQDLSHWGIQFGTCFVWEHLIGAATSANGTDWTSFIPSYQVDASQNCMTTPVLKFNVGTHGAAKTYYKVVISENYDVDPASPAYYKSGSRTGCCTFTFEGVGCPDDDEEEPRDFCALRQAHWLNAQLNNAWCQPVTFGSNSYSQVQGQTIWATSDPNGVALYAFGSAASIQLSQYCQNNGAPIPPAISAAYNTVVSFLSGLTYNDLLNTFYDPGTYSSVNTAAGVLNNWMAFNECVCVCGCGHHDNDSEPRKPVISRK